MAAPPRQKTNPKAGHRPVDKLLAEARQAQVAADKAVADVAATRRILAEAPRVIERHRKQVADAQDALAQAEARWEAAKRELADKQADAGHLVETAAVAQQALARALVNGADIDEYETLSLLATRWEAPAMPAAAAASNASAHAPANEPAPRPVGSLTRAYQPPPLESDQQVINYLAERDVLCPSCGVHLRGIQKARCPECRLGLTMNVLRAVRPRGASLHMWGVRLTAAFSMMLMGYIGVMQLFGKRLIGCGVQSDCDLIAASNWAKLFGVPLALPGAIMCAAVAFASFYTSIGHTDPVRRRAWRALIVLSMILAGAGVYFIAVQFAVMKGVCPHCLAANVLGIFLFGLILLRAPVLRREITPREATGGLHFPARQSGLLAGTAAIVLALTFGVQAISKPADRSIPSHRQAMQQYQEQHRDPADGLLMGGPDFTIRADKSRKTGGDADQPGAKDTPQSDPKDGAKDSAKDSAKDGAKPDTADPPGDKDGKKPDGSDKPDEGGLLIPGLSLDEETNPKPSPPTGDALLDDEQVKPSDAPKLPPDKALDDDH